LIIFAIVAACAAAGGGGWYLHSKHKAKVEAAGGNPAAQVPTPSAAQSSGALGLLTKVRQAYTNLTSLSVAGTSVSVIDMSQITAADLNSMQPTNARNRTPPRRPANIPKAMTNTTEISIKLARPDLYCIEGITKTKAGLRTMTNTIAIWSPGQTNYSLMLFSGYKNFMTLPDRKTAFMMNGQSGGLAMAIPQLFFNETDAMTDKFITDWGQTDDDAVNGQDCHTLTAKMLGQKLKIWVNKESYMVLQSQITLGAPISDTDIQAALDVITNNNVKMTPAQIAQMKAMAKQQAAMMTKIRGTITETYDNVQMNKTFADDDFNYPVPPGVRLVSMPSPPSQP